MFNINHEKTMVNRALTCCPHQSSRPNNKIPRYNRQQTATVRTRPISKQFYKSIINLSIEFSGSRERAPIHGPSARMRREEIMGRRGVERTTGSTLVARSICLSRRARGIPMEIYTTLKPGHPIHWVSLQTCEFERNIEK